MSNWKKVLKCTLAILMAATASVLVACGVSNSSDSDGSSPTESSNVVDTDENSDSDTDSESDSYTDTDTENSTDSDTDTDSDMDTNTDTNTDSNTDTDSSTDSDSDTNTDNDTDTDTDSSSEDLTGCEHVWTAKGFYEAPSCTNVGKRLYVCELNPEHTTLLDIGYQHEWSAWEFVTEPTCTAAGEKARHCTVCANVTETAPVTPNGHKLDGGVCSVCGYGPIYPDAPDTITYTKPKATAAGMGSDPYVPFELGEGYYEFTIGSAGVVWFVCYVEGAGQYALYSTNAPSGVIAKDCGSNTAFIPKDDNGNYIGTEARVLSDGNFYASVNIAEGYAPLELFAIYGTTGKKVQVRFVRIEEAAKTTERTVEIVYPQQINGKAADGEANTQLKTVDYTSSYFFDETLGYYRLGTPEEPGAIMYVAITKKATRINESLSFAKLAELGVSYYFFHSTAVDGTRIYKDYAWFLCNYGGEGKTSDTGRDFIPNAADPNALCYANYVNKDGVYPVTPELKEFLELYVSLNTPVTLQGETNQKILDNAWLAACYYYQKVAAGTKDSPIEVSPETFDVTTKALDYVYYKMTSISEETRTYLLTIEDANAVLSFDGKTYTGACSFEFTLSPEESINFQIIDATMMNSITFTISIVPVVAEE